MLIKLRATDILHHSQVYEYHAFILWSRLWVCAICLHQ
ncbi:hypothetical protein GYH30_021749 [Glycine max]|nr:hypothetical protein GYH30_021749 [Glycine max]